MMKLKRFMRRSMDNDVASLGMYVLILFGLTFGLYLFGFTSSMDVYLNTMHQSAGNGTNITNPDYQSNNDLIGGFINALGNFISTGGITLGVGIGAVVFGLVVAKALNLSGVITAVTNYVIPIILIGVVLNLFIFPMASLDTELRDITIWAIPLSWFLISFFNLIYVLAVLEFVSGRPVT